MSKAYSYEITDLRDIEPGAKLGLVGIILPVVGGINIKAINRRGLAIDAEAYPNDDDLPIEAYPNEGRMLLHMPEGTIIMERLTLANWRKNVKPFYGDNGQVFSRDSEVNEYYLDFVKRVE